MRTCVVVDDSSVVRKVARRIFEDLGFAVREAADGEDALSMCAGDMPELVLVDWKAPPLGGAAFVASLRAMPEGERPTALFCMSENDADQIAGALRAGADDYVLKPFNRETVEARLREVGVI